MKRDMDLVRHLLLEIERDPILDGTRVQVGTAAGFDLDPTEHSDAEVTYHLRMLIDEGFVKGEVGLPLAAGLTWKGHEFLDDIRDPEIWRETKNTLNAVAGAGIAIVWEVAKVKLKQKLGLTV